MLIRFRRIPERDGQTDTLPDDLRDPAVSTSTFRQSLKTHLFSAYKHV